MDFLQSAQDQKLFNFTPQLISAERNHLVQFIITKALEKIIKTIETPATSALLEAEKVAVVQQVQESCKRGLTDLADLDKKVFHVPPHILLSNDMLLEHQYTSDDEEQKITQLEQLKSKFRENMAMLAQLNAEETKFAAMEDVIQKEIQMQDMANEVCSSFNVSKLSQFCNRIASGQESATKN